MHLLAELPISQFLIPERMSIIGFGWKTSTRRRRLVVKKRILDGFAILRQSGTGTHSQRGRDVVQAVVDFSEVRFYQPRMRRGYFSGIVTGHQRVSALARGRDNISKAVDQNVLLRTGISGPRDEVVLEKISDEDRYCQSHEKDGVKLVLHGETVPANVRRPKNGAQQEEND
jgi:hypothetical protein